ncbi:MAG: HIRAN domain-containing protein [Myxococcota bacterium]
MQSPAIARGRADGPVRGPLFLAWQDPTSRSWFPVGRLWWSEGSFRFGYIRGFERAEREAGLEPLLSFPQRHQVYRSEHLFPLFRNRIMNSSREDFDGWLARLGLEPPDEDAREDLLLDILARSGGQRSTDSFEVFPRPLVGDRYRLEFFVHGLRHANPAARARAEALAPGDVLRFLADLQNPEDPLALALRTEDRHVVGYLPRYHCADLHALFGEREKVTVEVLQVNLPPTAPRHRILCRVEAAWPFSHPPLAQPTYDLLAT